MFRDGEPLSGSTSDPEEQLKAAYGIVFFIAGIIIARIFLLIPMIKGFGAISSLK